MNSYCFQSARLGISVCLLALGTLALAGLSAPAGATPFFSSLYSFSRSDGSEPASNLVQGSDGNFYGTTTYGGTSTPPSDGAGSGTIFKITPSGTLTTLFNFPVLADASSDGAYPQAGLVEGPDGDFYGTTMQGGPHNNGTIFKITPSGALTTLVYLNGTTGVDSSGLILGSDGNFYGAALDGGTGSGGTVFKMTPSGSLTVLANFTDATGIYPNASLVEGRDGNFYGSTTEGGANESGTLFKMTPGGTLTPLYSFDYDGQSVGYGVSAALVQGTDGDFYGTAGYGGGVNGEYGTGTVFKLTSDGAVTVLYHFSPVDTNDDNVSGAGPYGGLVQGADGNFYGTTNHGGSSGGGTVYKITPSGTLSTLVNFANTDGDQPLAGLALGSDGNLYGSTSQGGPSYSPSNNSYGAGTIFRVNPAAVPSALSFFPASGPIGSTVTLTGTNVDFSGVTAVRFHDASAKVFSASAGGASLTVIVPSGAMKGTITVTIPGGSVKSTEPFRVTYAPVITSFSPTNGPVGTVVTITGTHLSGITRVRFHNASATVYSSNASGTQLTVTVPPGADSGTITLDNRDTLKTTSTGVYIVTP